MRARARARLRNPSTPAKISLVRERTAQSFGQYSARSIDDKRKVRARVTTLPIYVTRQRSGAPQRNGVAGLGAGCSATLSRKGEKGSSPRTIRSSIPASPYLALYPRAPVPFRVAVKRRIFFCDSRETPRAISPRRSFRPLYFFRDLISRKMCASGSWGAATATKSHPRECVTPRRLRGFSRTSYTDESSYASRPFSYTGRNRAFLFFPDRGSGNFELRVASINVSR